MPLPPRFEHDFPSYLKDLSVKDIHVYWFHPEFTQSRYPPGQESNIKHNIYQIILFIM